MQDIWEKLPLKLCGTALEPGAPHGAAFPSSYQDACDPRVSRKHRESGGAGATLP